MLLPSSTFKSQNEKSCRVDYVFFTKTLSYFEFFKVTVSWKKNKLEIWSCEGGREQAASSQEFLLFFFCVFLALATKTDWNFFCYYFPEAELAKKLQNPSLFCCSIQLSIAIETLISWFVRKSGRRVLVILWSFKFLVSCPFWKCFFALVVSSLQQQIGFCEYYPVNRLLQIITEKFVQNLRDFTQDQHDRNQNKAKLFPVNLSRK